MHFKCSWCTGECCRVRYYCSIAPPYLYGNDISERISTLINRPELSWGRRVFYYLKDRVGSAGKCSRRSRGEVASGPILRMRVTPSFTHTHTHIHREAGTLSHARLVLSPGFLFSLSFLCGERKIKIARSVCVWQELTARAAFYVFAVGAIALPSMYSALWQTSPRLLLRAASFMHQPQWEIESCHQSLEQSSLPTAISSTLFRLTSGDLEIIPPFFLSPSQRQRLSYSS